MDGYFTPITLAAKAECAAVDFARHRANAQPYFYGKT